MRIVLALLLVGALMLVASRPAAASKRDEAAVAVQAVLDQLGVDRSRVKSIYLAPVGFARDAPVHSYTGWVAFNDCRGNLVVDLSQINSVRTMYTTGDCRVSGVR